MNLLSDRNYLYFKWYMIDLMSALNKQMYKSFCQNLQCACLIHTVRKMGAYIIIHINHKPQYTICRTNRYISGTRSTFSSGCYWIDVGAADPTGEMS